MNAAKTTTTRRAPDAPDCTPEDAAAYSAFYDKHYRIHIGLIHHMYPKLKREDTEELVSTAYMHLWQNWPKLRSQPDKAIRAWVDVTLTRRAIDLYRRRKLALRYEMSREEVRARVDNFAHRGNSRSLHSGDADLLALITEFVAACDAATDPERWAVARETLAEVTDFLRTRTAGGERTCRTVMAMAMGFSQAEIAAVQGRSEPAVKHDLLRARERIGAPRTTHTHNRVPKRKQAQEVAA